MSSEPNKEMSDSQKLSELQNVSTQPLFTCQTVFPFRIFPVVITLDREKLTISDYFFFNAKTVENFLIADIVSVTSTENWIFANLSLVSGMRLNRKVSVSYLMKEDARKLRELLEGMLIASRAGVDVLKVSNEELKAKTEDIGTAQM